jgi:hypothetical protein
VSTTALVGTYVAGLLKQTPGPVIAAGHSHGVLDGIGHNLTQEAPDAFAGAVLEVGGAK